MSNLGKIGLVVGGLFALKLWNDSAALAKAMKEKQVGTKTVNSFGGTVLPSPTAGGGSTGGTVTTNGIPVANSNENVDYGRNYLDIAEGMN